MSIARVQNAWTGVRTAVATGSAAFTNPPSAGNQIIVLVFSYYPVSTFGTMTITDSGGNAYTRAAFLDNGASAVGYCAIYYAENVATHAAPFSVSFVTTGNWYGGAEIIEYSGLNSSATLDVTATNGATSASYTSTSATTTNSADLLIAAHLIASTTATATPSGGFSTISMRAASFNEMQVQEWIVSSTGAYASTGTLSSSLAVTSVMATFKASGGAPPSGRLFLPANLSLGVGGPFFSNPIG